MIDEGVSDAGDNSVDVLANDSVYLKLLFRRRVWKEASSVLREDGLRHERCEEPGQAFPPYPSVVGARLCGVGLDNSVGHAREVFTPGQDERLQGV